jgi:hypothetical protein
VRFLARSLEDADMGSSPPIAITPPSSRFKCNATASEMEAPCPEPRRRISRGLKPCLVIRVDLMTSSARSLVELLKLGPSGSIVPLWRVEEEVVGPMCSGFWQGDRDRCLQRYGEC